MTHEMEALTRWILNEGRAASDPGELIEWLSAKLETADLRLARASLAIQILHPQYRARMYRWRRGESLERDDVGPRLQPLSDTYYQSPIARVHGGVDWIRQRLGGPEPDEDFPIFRELRERGATDYIAQSLPFSDSRRQFLSWVSDQPGGFTDANVALLRALNGPLAAVVELLVNRNLTQILLDAYLGRMTGGRVLKGSIDRGDRDFIQAVIWFCDLRGFTDLSERLAPTTLLGLLDVWFEHMVGAVHDHDGEVLKFMGDGMLAIFPVPDPSAEPEVCARALSAARAAQARITALDEERPDDGPALRFGLALHLGQVVYGNIGAPDRLDFTVIGRDVNRASRLEGLCRSLGVTLVASAEVAKHLGAEARSLGHHPLKGVPEPVEVFALS